MFLSNYDTCWKKGQFRAGWLRRKQIKQRLCCLKRVLPALVSVIVVHRALGCFCVQYVQLTDFSPDCVTKADAVEGADLPSTNRPKFDFTWVMASSGEFFPISSQRSLASIPLSKALKIASKSHSCLSMHLEIIKRRFVGSFSIRTGINNFPYDPLSTPEAWRARVCASSWS